MNKYRFLHGKCARTIFTHALLAYPSVNLFRNVYLASPAYDLFPLPCFFTSFASSF